MVSVALKFGQLIHLSLGMKISIAEHLDIVQCLHPFTYELRVDGRVKGLEYYLFFFCLVAEQQDYPLRQVMNKEKTQKSIYTKRIQFFFFFVTWIPF